MACYWGNLRILSKFEIPISFDLIIVLFGEYENRDLYRFDNLVFLTVKRYIFPVNINATRFWAYIYAIILL